MCPQRGIVDILTQGSQVGTAKAKKRRRTIKERRDIVEETLVPGASVARVARKHELNANQVFYGRKLFREAVSSGRSCKASKTCLYARGLPF
jgi:transposase